MGFNAAKNLIENASQHGKTTVDLGSQLLRDDDLCRLVDHLRSVSKIKRLLLSDNYLSDLPASLAELPHLTELALSRNRFTSLPRSIFEMSKLSRLILSGNQLTSLEDDFYNLERLVFLDLGANKLSELSASISRLSNLTELYLHGNELAELPRELEQLKYLKCLTLASNKLTALPFNISKLTRLSVLTLNNNSFVGLPSLSGLTRLTSLNLSNNQLTDVPEGLSCLSFLTHLNLSSNELSQLPSGLWNLLRLESLEISNNRLSQLSAKVGQLSKLRSLDFSDNEVAHLPAEVGNLTELYDLKLDVNPLVDPPPEVLNQGMNGILTYCRSKLTETSRQWISKMLVVGEGGVGKTQLIRSILDEEFTVDSETTFGIEIRPVKFPHPNEDDVEISLKAWDFGGQTIYHATHQFFLSNRSLFIVVWNARMGYEQCKLFYWLDTIKSLAPQSPVMIVATHIDERSADLPYDELKQSYPQIVGEWNVSNKERKAGGGIQSLRKDVVHHALSLPLMGEEWPTSWLKAANRIRKARDLSRKVTTNELWKLMDDDDTLPVPEEARNVLANWLHDLGDILYFHEDDELSDTVILDPHWVTKKISDVLVSDLVEHGAAILTHEALEAIWHDDEIDATMADRLLRLMENFDLSYRIPDDLQDRSLVVEKLSEDKAQYNEMWEKQLQVSGCKEISMTFDLGQKKPAGIPTWFIARTHRFTQHMHWLHGAMFGDSRQDPRHLALVLAPAGQEHVSITVRGPNPHSFFALLKDGLEVTLDRFEGLKGQIIRTVPCPDPESQGCQSHFKLSNLEQRLELPVPRTTIECQSCLANVSVTELLFGISYTTDSKVLERLDEMEKNRNDSDEAIRELINSQFKELTQLSQRQFLTLFNSQQRLPESQTPRVFTLRAAESINWKDSLAKIYSKKWSLQLYCEAPGCWHPPENDKGLYRINDTRKFFKGIGKWTKLLIGVLKYCAPVVGPSIAYAYEEINGLIENDIKLMKELVNKLPDIEIGKDRIKEVTGNNQFRHRIPAEHRSESLSELRAMLISLDPDLEFGKMGGLTKTLTPEGHFLWLCDAHRQEIMI